MRPIANKEGIRTSRCSSFTVSPPLPADRLRCGRKPECPAVPSPPDPPQAGPPTSHSGRVAPGVAYGVWIRHPRTLSPSPQPHVALSRRGRGARRSTRTAHGAPIGSWSAPANADAGGGRWAARSHRQAGAAFAAAGREDGTPGTRAHAQAETVLLVTAPVVRLVRTFHGCPSKSHEDDAGAELAPIDNQGQ